ncbi:MAG: M3 family oligoendopeptidase [Candidatus Zixiibacteriota bacterium]
MTTSAKIPPAPKWDLDSIFRGGSKSEDFRKHRENVKAGLKEASAMIDKLPESIDDNSRGAWVEVILKLQSLLEDIELTKSFANALASANVEDSTADAVYGEGHVLLSRWEKLRTQLEALSMAQSDDQWKMLLADPRLEGIRFYLDELRVIARSKMPVELESLALELSVNGYHAWNQIYDKMAGGLRVDFEEHGKVGKISMGQLATKMASPDREIRKQAFEKMVQGWSSRADLAAMMLNALSGFRLTLYDRRGWEPPVKEALVMSRTQEKTVDTMWEVISRETKRLQPYINAKKKLLGIDKYAWYDEFAPCGSVNKMYSFEEAGEFIRKNIAGLSPDMADFCKMALEKRWVEAEDRPGKRAGAYCTGTGKFRQPRVFMTYAGSYDNLLTLAHELGHAYHGWVLKDKPYFSTIYPMNLAETASIFAETLVNDAALAQATDPQEKLMLVEQKLQSAYVMFTDLHCRYLFDRAFYEERKHGVVGPDQLSELMVEAQKKAFCGLLDESGYHPLFWCSKLHFYISDQPFYNFPYTFGYLFAGGVYDRAKKEGPAFARQYKALLAETGSMTTEQMAQKYLGVDLTKEDFWVDAINRSLADVDEFVKLADSLS